METDIKIRKVTQDVLKFVCFKNKIIAEEPVHESCFIPEISAELFENLNTAVWMESYRNGFVWNEFFKNHFDRMTCSPYLFTVYAAYAFDILGQNENALEYFYHVLSLLTYFVLHSWQRERKVFINAHVEMFCAYFKQYIFSKFEKQGGWQHLNGYLEEKFILTTYKSLVSDNKCPLEYFKTLFDEDDPVDELEYEINGVLINCVSSTLVEDDQKSVRFAKIVKNKISELCKKEFDEILMDFAKTDRKVKAIYQEIIRDASDGMAREVECSSSQKTPESVPINPESERKEHERQKASASGSLENQNLGNINSQDVDASVKALQVCPKLNKSERAKKLLGDISMDMGKLSDAIQSLCNEYGVNDPVKAETTL